jgi:hypothetical protein
MNAIITWLGARIVTCEKVQGGSCTGLAGDDEQVMRDSW